jgi:drug/metabolite transporter (DMT)-like permease
MIAIVGGLGAAFMWATANLVSSRSGRLIGSSSTVAWMMLVGLVTTTPLALASGPVPPLTPMLAVWLAGSSLGSVSGLLLVYRGLAIGKVGVVTALASTEGAIAAVLAVIAGERLTLPVAVMLCVIAVGIAIVALAAGDAARATSQPAEAAARREAGGAIAEPRSGPTPERQAALFGATAALCFGVTIYSTAQLGLSMPPFMAVLPVRVLGTAVVFLPMALAGRLRMTRRAAPMVVLIGVAEVLGNAAYVVGSRESIAIAAVMASQFAAVAAVAAYFLFRERLSPAQRSGVVAIVVGVAMLAAVRA